jgi:hypothetical protein
VPSSSTPTCSKCSSLLLNHYAQSLDETSTMNGTIVQAAINKVNSHCGPAFATYSASSKSAANPRIHLGSWPGIATAALGMLATAYFTI